MRWCQCVQSVAKNLYWHVDPYIQILYLKWFSIPLWKYMYNITHLRKCLYLQEHESFLHSSDNASCLFDTELISHHNNFLCDKQWNFEVTTCNSRSYNFSSLVIAIMQHTIISIGRKSIYYRVGGYCMHLHTSYFNSCTCLCQPNLIGHCINCCV